MSFINDSYPYGMLVLDDSKQYYIYSQVGHSNSVVVSTGIIRNLCVPTTTFKGMDTNTLQTDQLYTIGLSGTQASIPNILFNTLSGSTMSWASGALPEITSTECNTNLIETTNASLGAIQSSTLLTYTLESLYLSGSTIPCPTCSSGELTQQV